MTIITIVVIIMAIIIIVVIIMAIIIIVVIIVTIVSNVLKNGGNSKKIIELSFTVTLSVYRSLSISILYTPYIQASFVLKILVN